MKSYSLFLKGAFCISFIFIFNFLANYSQEKKKKDDATKQTTELQDPVITNHSVELNGEKIDYSATAGYLTLKDKQGNETANIFFVSYIKTNTKKDEKRPLTFSFNGGPGSSSVWLHIGVLGPYRVLMTDSGNTMPPPYKMVKNDYSWLQYSDLVFIDPVSTGFSHSTNNKTEKKFHSFYGDVSSVGDFIRRFLTENNRWASPKFIIGESYGTTRAVGLSEHLASRYGIYLNGLILVSAVMDFQTIRFDRGNELPYQLFLPTYAAAAHYHNKMDANYADIQLEPFLSGVEDFVSDTYTKALFLGDKLPEDDENKVIQEIHKYTGLPGPFVSGEHLRIHASRFRKELLRSEKLSIGRYDCRYTIEEYNSNNNNPEFDPSYQPAVHGAFSNCINDYLGRELGFQTYLPYEVLTGKVHPWNYNASNEYLNVAEHLRKIMIKNPDMDIWILNGYYDLATPYFATKYTINHLQVPLKLKENIRMTYYKAGHMMYLHKPSLIKMTEDARQFYQK